MVHTNLTGLPTSGLPLHKRPFQLIGRAVFLCGYGAIPPLGLPFLRTQESRSHRNQRIPRCGFPPPIKSRAGFAQEWQTWAEGCSSMVRPITP